MLIKKITIRNFGKIHDRTFELSDGLNVIYGDNESGKTTLHTFIRCMLYGIPRLRGRPARNDTYRTYEPWDNPGEFGGTLWFEADGLSYRLTRSFSRERPFGELLCETTGERTDPDDGSLEEILGNVSEAVYENTVSIGQTKSVTGQDLVRELQNYIAGYEGGADSTIDLQRANQMLKMTRKGFQVQEDRRKKTIQSEQIRIQSRIGYLEEEEKKLETRIRALEIKKNEMDPEGIGESGYEAEAVRKRQNAHIIGLCSAIISCILFILAMLVLRRTFRAGAFLCGLVILAAGFFRRYTLEQEAKQLFDMEEKWNKRFRKLTWETEQAESSLLERQTAEENLREEYDEMEDALFAVSPELSEIRALSLALQTIESISGNINLQIGNRLRERTSRILSGITGGKYTEVLMDEELRMSVNTEKFVVPLERLSRGTLEQIYFSLRMAAGELFCGGKPFPVILDDVFGMYDVERLMALLVWLSAEERQVLIRTCSGREGELLAGTEIPFNEIVL